MFSLSSVSTSFPFSVNFGGQFCYHSDGKVKLIPDLYTRAIVLKKKNLVKSIFLPNGGIAL